MNKTIFSRTVRGVATQACLKLGMTLNLSGAETSAVLIEELVSALAEAAPAETIAYMKAFIALIEAQTANPREQSAVDAAIARMETATASIDVALEAQAPAALMRAGLPQDLAEAIARFAKNGGAAKATPQRKN